MRILGIDPGFATIGFGLIELIGQDWEMIDFGVISTEAGEDFQERLCQIYDDLNEILEEFEPNLVAIESLYFSKNVTTAMQVAESRGVISLAVAQANLPLQHFSPNEVKLAITGYGSADKVQVQNMVATLLNLSAIPRPDDAADALAIALTCGFNSVHI